MKIKYKLIIFSILIILCVSIPLSLFILNEYKNNRLSLIRKNGFIYSRMLARSTLSILMMNEGNIQALRLDSDEMMALLKPLKKEGLLYAESILLSSKKEFNGLILAKDSIDSIESFATKRTKVSEKTLIKYLKSSSYSEIYMEEIGHQCYQYIAVSSFKGGYPKCIGRILFSKKIILQPISDFQNTINWFAAVIIVITVLVSLFLSGLITKPIYRLIDDVEHIGGGDFSYRIKIQSKDEFAKLARTFNHLALVVNLELNELLANNHELKRIDSLKDEFFESMSHEMRMPINGIIGLSESLLGGSSGSLDDTMKHDLSLIAMSGRRMSLLVNDIIELSKLRNKDVTLELEPLDVHIIANHIIALVTPLMKNKSINLINMIPPEEVFVVADLSRLQQILYNLVSNAVQYTEIGDVTINYGKSQFQDDEIAIFVSDSGIGMAEDEIDNIFEEGNVKDSNFISHGKGLGFSLSITKYLVELHGGKIEVISEPGHGSQFSFYLKEYLPKTGETIEKPELLMLDESVFESLHEKISLPNMKNFSGSASHGKILIVDNDPVSQQVLINHLILEGYSVSVASYGEEVFEIIKNKKAPDLILIDVLLPRISGYDVCRKVREDFSQYELPILMLTSKTKIVDVVAGLDAGANDYLSKPIDRQELMARVNNLISLKESIESHNELTLIKRDLHIAHEIQQSVMLKEVPHVDKLSVAIEYHPMTELGGDFYNIQMIDDSMVSVLIADVSGHGIPAAIICSMLKVASSFHFEYADDPAVFLTKINNTMYEFTHGQFITACYACIDLDKKVITQANAGHWPLLVKRKNQDDLIYNTENGIPIGWSDDEIFINNQIHLEDGDRIVLYTDGITEARNSKDKMYGQNAFYSLIANNGSSDINDFSKLVIKEITEWTGVQKISFDDDVTLIIIDLVEG